MSQPVSIQIMMLMQQKLMLNDNGIPYCNKNGFVWGVKVPVGVKHTYERVPFAEAYPQFTEWAQSNGAQNKDWYLAPLYGKVVEAW